MRLSVSQTRLISQRYSKNLSHPVRIDEPCVYRKESWDHVIPASPSVRKTPHLSPYQRRSLSVFLLQCMYCHSLLCLFRHCGAVVQAVQVLCMQRSGHEDSGVTAEPEFLWVKHMFHSTNQS